MQDDSKYNYNPELVDRGWSLLEKQLEEVLPQKPKRRFAWFWLPLLLGFSTLAGAGWYLTTTQDTTNKPSHAPLVRELQEQPMVQSNSATPEYSTASKSNETITADVATGENQFAMIATSSVSTANGFTNSLPLDDNTAYSSNRDNIELISSHFDQVTPTFAPDNTITQYVAENMIKVVEPNTEDTAEAMISNSPETVVSTLALPRLGTTLLKEKPPTVALGTVNLLTKNRRNWRYYVESQLTIALGEQAGLLGAALGVERKLGQSWHLGLGLAYERSQQKLSTNDIAYNLSQAEAAFVNTGYVPEAYNINQAYQAVSYDRLKGELQTHYQLHPRWRVGGGLSLAYYRQAFINTNQVSEFSAVEGVGSPSTDVNNHERFDLFEDVVSVYEFDPTSNAAVGPYPLAPSRWQLAGTLALQYQLARLWAINLNYRHDLTEWQSTSSDFGNSSFAQFGLRYYFK
jgi:hypothetical protein